MVKQEVADHIRDQIMTGKLAPGERIVELRWAKELGVAQTSVREAINILCSEGLLRKTAGRCAEVFSLTLDQNTHAFDVRTLLEGLAARLIAQHRPDLSPLRQVVADMGAAAACSNPKAFHERDIAFHLTMAELSGNCFIVEAVKPVIVSSLANVLMRVNPFTAEPDLWIQSVQDHAAIVKALELLDPEAAERTVKDSIRRFERIVRGHLIRLEDSRRSLEVNQ